MSNEQQPADEESLDSILNYPGWDRVLHEAIAAAPVPERPKASESEDDGNVMSTMGMKLVMLLCAGGLIFLGANAGAQSALRSSIQNLVRIKSKAILLRTKVISELLAERGYLLHEYGGGVQAHCAEVGMDFLVLTCQQHSDLKELGLTKGSYAGINLYGNDVITGSFSPIDLSRVESFDIEYRYPPNTTGEFAVELKNLENYETNRMTLRTDVRGEWQVFRIMDQPEAKVLTDPALRSSLITTISLFTDDFGRWGNRAQIEIRSIKLKLR